jgi:hypothetical protein
MDATERYYRLWIKKIAKRTDPRELEEHILHHAQQLRDDPYHNLPLNWVTSMHNLCTIYEEVNKVRSTYPAKVYKLASKFWRYKDSRTKPPGGKIPKDVGLKFVIPGEGHNPKEVKPPTIKELRNLSL